MLWRKESSVAPAVRTPSEVELRAEGILGQFEGDPVTAVGMSFTNVAGAMNESLEVEPHLMHKGETCFVVLRCDCVSVQFPNVKGNEDQSRRVQVMRVTDATVLREAPATVQRAIDRMRAEIQARRDAEDGQGRLMGDERL